MYGVAEYALGARDLSEDGGLMVDSTKNEAGYVAAEVLARAGVRRLYTVPGESFLEILDAAEEHPDLSLGLDAPRVGRLLYGRG